MLDFVFKKYAGFYTLIFVLGVLNNAAFPFPLPFFFFFLIDLLPIQICVLLFDVFESTSNFQVNLDSQIKRTCHILLVKLLHISNLNMTSGMFIPINLSRLTFDRNNCRVK